MRIEICKQSPLVGAYGQEPVFPQKLEEAVFLTFIADELIKRDQFRTRENRTIRTLEEWVSLVLSGRWP